MAISLAACGGSSDSASSAAASSAAASSAASEAASSAASSAASEASSEAADAASESEDAGAAEDAEMVLVEDGVLHMATNAAFPPYEMTTDDGGFEGIDVEIATAIAEKLGLELVVDNMDFSSVITAVQGGKSDIAMAGMTVNEERKQNVDFTDTYANAVQVIIVTEDSDIATVDDLDGKMIGVQQGTTGHIYCEDDYGADNVTAYDTGATATQALLTGKVDCVVIDSEPAKAYVAENEGLKILDTEYANEDYAIGIGKENAGLYNAVNDALNELIDDGTVQSIVDKYITE
ncbi:MAG: amino acid ABC transporter substrate-binding protein [Eubacterium sp.]|nr:amino acid ABC transporter substrate-binding protein [Eubacterium sp.]